MITQAGEEDQFVLMETLVEMAEVTAEYQVYMRSSYRRNHWPDS